MNKPKRILAINPGSTSTKIAVYEGESFDRIRFIAPFHVYPDEDEMRALAFNGLQILKGEANVKLYK